MAEADKSTLLLATTNPAKQARLQGLVAGLPFSARTPAALSLHVDVPENGRTHQENALLKAVAWSRRAGCFALASDGGLVVPALGGQWDSLHTNRFAGPGASDAARAEALLQLMRHLTGQERRMAWVEAAALAQNGVPLACWEVRGGDGLVATSFDSAAMEPGFWMTGLWSLTSLDKTYAQASPEELAWVGEPWSRLRALVREALATYLAPV